MDSSVVACSLYEPDGTPLAAGTAHLTSGTSAWEALVAALDLPGRVVQRCLLGGVREIRVRLGDGVPMIARVERVFFDPKLGRVCALSAVAA